MPHLVPILGVVMKNGYFFVSMLTHLNPPASIVATACTCHFAFVKKMLSMFYVKQITK